MEGPSVHRIADRLQRFKEQIIEHVDGNARQPKEWLQGQSITNVRAVKKRLFIETAGATAVIHFLMYGSYRVNERRDLDERLSLYCSQDELHLYSCSAKVLRPDSDILAGYDDPVGDVLSPQFDRQRAIRSTRSDERTIADVLLDQNIYGGIGNILKNEILYAERIHPASRASAIKKERVASLVTAAIDHATAWYQRKTAGTRREWTVYRQHTCPACGGELTRKKMGASNRITFFCERCQRRYPG